MMAVMQRTDLDDGSYLYTVSNMIMIPVCNDER